jgi:hypothetical protein
MISESISYSIGMCHSGICSFSFFFLLFPSFRALTSMLYGVNEVLPDALLFFFFLFQLSNSFPTWPGLHCFIIARHGLSRCHVVACGS